MRKFKVVKAFPLAKVGDVLEWNESADGYLINGPRNGTTGNGSTIILQQSALEGFAEEIKEQDEFWYIDTIGEVRNSDWSTDYVPKWKQFRTKESAEKFRDALEEIKKINVVHGESGYFFLQESDWNGGRTKVKDLVDALNDRVK